MQNKKVSILIPDSLLSETNDLKIKTSKVGLVGRALAIFNVDQVFIYKDVSTDENHGEDGDFSAEILNFMNTPQYLRKRAFPIKSELKHVGILPPLRTPNHPIDAPKLGDYRQGFTVKRTRKGTYVDIGIDDLVFCKEQLSVNKIFSFRITKLSKEIIVTPDEPDGIYWGYKTLSTHKTLKNSLKLIKPQLVLETTRYGDEINTIFNELKFKIKNSNNIAILFGGPYFGITEDVSDSSWDLNSVNFVPSQGTKTVRTEEAIYSTLSIFNVLRFMNSLKL